MFALFSGLRQGPGREPEALHGPGRTRADRAGGAAHLRPATRQEARPGGAQQDPPPGIVVQPEP